MKLERRDVAEVMMDVRPMRLVVGDRELVIGVPVKFEISPDCASCAVTYSSGFRIVFE